MWRENVLCYMEKRYMFNVTVDTAIYQKDQVF